MARLLLHLPNENLYDGFLNKSILRHISARQTEVQKSMELSLRAIKYSGFSKILVCIIIIQSVIVFAHSTERPSTVSYFDRSTECVEPKVEHVCSNYTEYGDNRILEHTLHITCRDSCSSEYTFLTKIRSRRVARSAFQEKDYTLNSLDSIYGTDYKIKIAGAMLNDSEARDVKKEIDYLEAQEQSIRNEYSAVGSNYAKQSGQISAVKPLVVAEHELQLRRLLNTFEGSKRSLSEVDISEAGINLQIALKNAFIEHARKNLIDKDTMTLLSEVRISDPELRVTKNMITLGVQGNTYSEIYQALPSLFSTQKNSLGEFSFSSLQALSHIGSKNDYLVGVPPSLSKILKAMSADEQMRNLETRMKENTDSMAEAYKRLNRLIEKKDPTSSDHSRKNRCFEPFRVYKNEIDEFTKVQLFELAKKLDKASKRMEEEGRDTMKRYSKTPENFEAKYRQEKQKALGSSIGTQDLIPFPEERIESVVVELPLVYEELPKTNSWTHSLFRDLAKPEGTAARERADEYISAGECKSVEQATTQEPSEADPLEKPTTSRASSMGSRAANDSKTLLRMWFDGRASNDIVLHLERGAQGEVEGYIEVAKSSHALTSAEVCGALTQGFLNLCSHRTTGASESKKAELQLNFGKNSEFPGDIPLKIRYVEAHHSLPPPPLKKKPTTRANGVK